MKHVIDNILNNNMSRTGLHVSTYIIQTSTKHNPKWTHDEVEDTEKQKLVDEILMKPPMFTTLRANTIAESTEKIKTELKKLITLQYENRKESCPPVLSHSQLPDLLVIPSKGPLQLEKYEKEVIVDHLCGCAVLRGADVFAQGIIGAPANMQKGDNVSVYADLDGKCKKGLMKPYEGQKVFVGNGVAHYSRSALFVHTVEKPSGLGIEMTDPLYEAPSLSGIMPSLLFPQNLPSTVTAHVLEPQPGETVLDMCAAPGGKTTHIATLMKNEGQVFALDKSEGRVARIRQNAENWNLTNIKSFAFDGTKALNCDSQESYITGPPFPPKYFDRILLDGPCSGLGQRPVLVDIMSKADLESYPRLQKSLFAVAVELLKPGGTLVYSTCTITVEENEQLVSWALNKYPVLELATQIFHLGGCGWPVDGLTPEQCTKLQRFNPFTTENNSLPHSIDKEVKTVDSHDISTVNIDTIGFFIAKFVKKG